jgi:hypothetical protein
MMAAGLVTVGMEVDEFTGEIKGLPKPFSVDGRSVAPYRELLECTNERRWRGPDYALLRRELRGLESPDVPGYAPDHPLTNSKDAADTAAGVVGYLSIFGHAILEPAHTVEVDREQLKREYGIPDTPDFQVGAGDEDFQFDPLGGQFAGFDV